MEEVPSTDMPAQETVASAVPTSDMPEVSGQEVPDSDLHQDTSKYGTPEQQAITAAEGLARGASFGLSTGLETSLGLAKPEDIAGRQQENPLIAAGADATGTVGSMFVPGVGEGWLLGKAAKAIVPIAEEANALAKVGRLALRGMIETAGFATGEEISDAFLHKGHDAEAVASHIIGSGATGLLVGGTFGASAEGLQAIQNAKLGEYLDNFAIGLGRAANGDADPKVIKSIYKEAGLDLPKGFEHGIKFYNELGDVVSEQILKRAPSTAVAGALGTVGGRLAGPVGAVIGTTTGYKLAEKWIDPAAEKLASKYAPTITKKVLVPIMLQAIKTGETTGLSNVLNYGTKAAQGAKLMNKAVDSLLKVGSQEAINFEMSERDNDRLNKYIENGGINQQIDELKHDQGDQQFAEGGRVIPKPIKEVDGLSRLYPEQHLMITATKGRVSNYLNSIRPVEAVNKPLFDTKYEDPRKKRAYHSALNIANQPLSVLKHVQDGTLKIEHVQHLSHMYPEVHASLSKKITDKLMEHQKDGTRPPYKVRQGLSLLLGAPLDSSFTPESIQAAQATFVPKQQPQKQQEQQSKNKKSTAPLGKKTNKMYQTATQDAEEDRISRD